MEAVRDYKPSTYDIGSRAALVAVLILILAILTGCSNYTIVKLAELCHDHDGKPAVSFSGETGKVICQ